MQQSVFTHHPQTSPRPMYYYECLKTVPFATCKKVLADDKGTSWTDMETHAK